MSHLSLYLCVSIIDPKWTKNYNGKQQRKHIYLCLRLRVPYRLSFLNILAHHPIDSSIRPCGFNNITNHPTCPPTCRSNVTPNAQESEDSGVSLSYSLVSNDVARRIQPPTTEVVVVSDALTERDNYDDQITAYREDSKKVKNLKDDFRCARRNKYCRVWARSAMLRFFYVFNFSDQFTRITTVEQRRKYKTEFDNDFQEYRRLHEIVERVSRKFAQLEEDLQMERHNERRYKVVFGLDFFLAVGMMQLASRNCCLVDV